MKFLQQIAGGLLDLFFPPICRSCQKMIAAKTDLPLLCETCLSELTPVSPAYIAEKLLPSLRPRFIDRLWVAFPFHGVAQAVIHAVKYEQMPDNGVRTGQYLRRVRGEEMSRLLASGGIIPIPLHASRQKARGYNQSERLARGAFGAENVLTGVLVRQRATESQAKLNRSLRQQNVRGAFAVIRPERIRGKSFVLFDDVFTTGATMNECARVLKKNGAAAVAGIAFATPVDPDFSDVNGNSSGASAGVPVT